MVSTSIHAQYFTEKHEVVTALSQDFQQYQVVDWDNDGLKDVLHFYGTSNVLLRRNLGNQSFDTPIVLFESSQCSDEGLTMDWHKSVFCADINQDGLLDVYSIGSQSSTTFKKQNLLWLENVNGLLVEREVLLDSLENSVLIDINNDSLVDVHFTKDGATGWHKNVDGLLFEDTYIIANISSLFYDYSYIGMIASLYGWGDAKFLELRDVNDDNVLDQLIFAREYIFEDSSSGGETRGLEILVSMSSDSCLWNTQSLGSIEVNPPLSFDHADAYFYQGTDFEEAVFFDQKQRFIDINGDSHVDSYKIVSGSLEIAYSDGTASVPTNFMAANVSSLLSLDRFHFQDINDDGLLDLFYLSQNVVKIRLNLGDHTFGDVHFQTLNFASTNLKDDILFEDLDSDGKIDFLLSSERIYFQNNEGTFSLSEHFTTPGEAGFKSLAIQVRDIDKDGYNDVLYLGHKPSVTPKSRLSYFRNTAGGSFEREKILHEDVSKTYTIEDLDGNGTLDFIYFIENRLRFFTLNNQDNTGQEIDLGEHNLLGPISIEVYDFEKDGDMDILLLGQNDSPILLNNLGNLEFELDEFIVFNLAKDLIKHDFNSDSFEDFIFRRNDSLVVAINDGSLNYDFYNFYSDRPIQDYIIGDFDLDGDDDFVFSEYNENSKVGSRLALIENLGSDGWELIVASDEVLPVSSITHGDFDKDGVSEILLSVDNISDGDKSILYFKNIDQALTFSSPREVYPTSLASRQNLLAEDIDSDGDLDVLFIIPRGCGPGSTIVNGFLWLENDTKYFEADFEYFSCSELQFVNTSFADYDEVSVQWDFGNGLTSTEIQPSDPFDEPGVYEVSLTLCNNTICDTTIQNIEVVHFYTSEFEIQETAMVGDALNFQSPVDGFSNYSWVFGDGEVSLEQNPTHTYQEPGTYLLEFYATDNAIVNCTQYYFSEIIIEGGSGIDVSNSIDITVSPNPSNGIFTLDFNQVDTSGFFRVFDLSGKILHDGSIDFQKTKLNLSDYHRGIYLVEIVIGDDVYHEKLVLR